MYSRITASKNGRSAIKYAAGKGPGQNGRCVLVTTVNMMPNGHYAEQMAPLWRMARANHKVQVRRIVISFSKKELDPQSEEDLELANTIVREFIKTYYPDRQVALFFQNDGRGGCLHCHCIVNDISLSDHKGCSRTQQYYKYVRNGIDTVASKYIELDKGDKLASRQTHTERAKSDKTAQIMDAHPELQGDDLRKVLIQQKAYSYKEDMKERIHAAALKSKDIVSFFRELKARGIEAIKKISPKYGEHYVYDFKMCPVGVKNTKARSYKLGYSYGPEAIKEIWQEQNKQKNSDGNDFAKWMREHGQSCFIYDGNGRLVDTDWSRWEELHEEYEKEKASIGTPAPQSESTAGGRKVNSNRAVRHRKVSPKDKAAVSQLLKGTEGVINKLSADQLERTLSADRHRQAEAQLQIDKRRQMEKSL